ncbi:MAG: serine hydrolase [bacterium]
MTKPFKWFTFLFLFLPLLPSLGAAQDEPNPAAIRTILQERIDKNKKSVGIVVGVINSKGSQVIGYGKLSKERSQEPDGNTVYEIGSITKVFTSILLQDMAEHGELSLTDPLSKHLPKSVKTPTKDGKEITLLHLATHTSGLPRLPDNLDMKNADNPYVDYTVEQMYDFLSRYQLTRGIGEKYEYSNYGAGLLGHLLALKAGTDYETLVTKRICAPLKMSSTAIKLSPAMQARLAQGHNEVGRPASNWDIPTLAGAGALHSTATDMLLFIAANLGFTKSVLTPVMQKTHATQNSTGMANLEIALGWHILKKDGSEIVWHNGGTGGYRSFIGFDKNKGLGVVVLSNSTNDIDDIGRHLLNPKFELAKLEPTKERTAIKVDPKIYGAYVGNYELTPSFVIAVTKEGEHIFAQATGQPRFEIFPESEIKFFLTVVDAQITFAKDDKGQVTNLILHQNGIDQKARKLGPEYQPPPPRKEVAVNPEILKNYVGQYELAPSFIFDVIVENNQLMVQLTGQPRFPVFAESETKFFYKVVDAQLTFQKDGTGKVTSLILHQGGIDQTAKKK